jgi:branched-chain amino acid transport system substrate-binding protein
VASQRIPAYFCLLVGTLFTLAACQPASLPSAASAPAANPTATKPASIKLGTVLPLSGPAAALGQFAREGIDLAVEEINAAGGVSGAQFEVVHEDGKAAAKDSVDAFNKLSSIDKTPVVITMATAPLLAIAPISDQQGILLMCGGCNSPVTHGVSKLYLNNTSLGESEGKAALEYVVAKLGVKSMAVLGTTDEAGKSHAQWAKDHATELGLSYLGTEFVDIGTPDVSSQIAKINALRPDIVYMTAFGKDLSLALKQAREGGINGPIVAQAAVESPDTITAAGAAADNTYYGYAVPPADKVSPTLHDFQTRYHAKYGRDPEQFGGNMYDLVYFTKQAVAALLQQGQPITGQNVWKTMTDIKTFEGVGGTTTFQPDGTSVKAVYPKMIKDGKFIYAAE